MATGDRWWGVVSAGLLAAVTALGLALSGL
jgi:hypothetical protein